MTADGQAQTLNYLLGNLGGRRKSWMTDASPSSAAAGGQTMHPVPPGPRGRGRGRPPKRPPIPPPPTHQNHAHMPMHAPAPPFVDARAERQPPSKSTSPYLANTVARSARGRDGASTALPSPSPSKENTPTASNALARGAQPTSSTTVDSAPLESAAANAVPVSPVANRPMQANTSNVERSNFPVAMDSGPAATSASPRLPQLQHLRRPSMPHMPTGSIPHSPVHGRRTSLGHHPNNPALSPPSQHMQSIDLNRVRSPHQVPVPQAANPISWNIAQASFQSAQSPQLPTAPAAPSQYFPPAPTVPSSNWYTPQECLNILNAFLATSPIPLEQSRDWRRLAVLKDAIEHHDWAYLTMHQYYCLLTTNRNAAPPGLLHQASLDVAIRVMFNVLDSNEALSPDVLRFFVNFPYPIEELGQKWPPAFQEQAHLFWLFISHSPNYDSLKTICEGRRFPPLARELAIDLRISSGTFQRLLFTSFLRYIWRQGPHGAQQVQFETEAITIFQQNQADFCRREAMAVQSNTVQSHEAEKSLEVRVWGTTLRALGLAFEGGLQGSLQGLGAALTNQNTALLPQPPGSPSYPPHPHLQAQAGAPPAPRLAQMPPDTNAAKRKRGRPPALANQVRMPPTAAAPPRPPLPSPRQTRPGGPLLPLQGWTQPQQRVPNPMRFGLHQAHLRSPVLRTKSLASPLYHYFEGFAQCPVRLADGHQSIQKWTFTLTPAEFQAIPLPDKELRMPGGPEVRIVDDKSKTVRIRCIKWPGDQMPTDHAWAVADTAWIPYSFFTFNGKSLEQRKKVHNGKDLPMDVTGLLREGQNVLEVAVVTQNKDTAHLKYLIGIEVLGVASHASIKQNCLANKRVAAKGIVQRIQNKLSGGNNEDDEIAVVESNLTIGLFDPFSACKMCEIPVRSSACLHNDCFDLETYLQTRRRKGDTSMPDQWRCPICNADARPQHLMIDGFLEEVGKSLARQGLSETRAIIVQQDGTWKPKAEVRDANGVSDRGASNEPPPTPNARAPPSAPMEIIDLSD